MSEDLVDLPVLPSRTAVPHNIEFDPDLLEADQDSDPDSPLPVIFEQPTTVDASSDSSSSSDSESDPEDTDYQP